MNEAKWTRFYDMHSGGGAKLEWDTIAIQMPEEKAIRHFEECFGRDPKNVTCQCCGEDYSISQYGSWSDIAKFEVPECVVLADGTKLIGDSLSAWVHQ